MQTRRKILSTLALLAALPAAAAETKWQVGLGLNALQGIEITNLNGIARIKRESKAAPALLVGYQVWNFGSSEISAMGEYQFQTKYNLTSNIDLGDASFRGQFFAPGLQWTYHGPVDAGAGLQARFERLRGTALGQTVSTNYNRAWLNGYVGYTFSDLGSAAPFVGLRVAAALSKTEPPRTLNTDGDFKTFLRSMDGDAEVALQVGARF